MKFKVRLERNVYLIILGVLLLAAATQINRSEYLLTLSRNGALTEQQAEWKPQAADPATLKPSGRPYCIAYDGADALYSVNVERHAVQLLRYMKKPVQSVDLSREIFDPASCALVIAPISDLRDLGDVNTLQAYIRSGGYLFVAGHLEENDAFYRMYRRMGILAAGESVNATGIELTSNVLIGEEGLRIEEDFIMNSSLQIELEKESRLLARSAEGIPLLWDYSYGEGKVMVFNGTMLQEKVLRGVLAGAIGLLEPDFIYPVFNMSIMYLDDFPAPIGQTVDPEIYREYGRDRPAFFKEIWWPDMLQAAKRYGLKYTAVLIESYEDRVKPPFAKPIDQDSKGLISFGREVIKSGGEVGLHGYNHQSLTMDRSVSDEYGYQVWESISDMTQSVEEAVSFMKEAFPAYRMTSYVPPSNVLSPEGREALSQGWPGLAVISSLYGEDATGLSYVQEYEIAPDGILEMPRITSGYAEYSYDRFIEANTMTSLGIISHFIHPDDLLDEERNFNLTWKQLYDRFIDMLVRRESTYPWLRHMTSTEAATDMEMVLNSRVDWIREGTVLKGKISPFRGDMHFVLRSRRSILSLTNCEARMIDKGTYLITAHQADFEMKLGD